MEKTYLGETIVEQKHTEFKDYTTSDWSLYFIGMYGRIDGSHHKDWVMDQCARVLNGAQVEIKEAKWSNGFSEYRINVLKPSQKYHDWVKMLGDDCYEIGVAP